MSIETERIVRGNKRLAEILGVTPVTVCLWRRKGYLAGTTLVDTGRTIVYDLELVFKAMGRMHEPAQPGMKRIQTQQP